MVSPDYMRNKLREWNPQWNPQTIEGFSLSQLRAVYQKEQQKVVSHIRLSLGLSN